MATTESLGWMKALFSTQRSREQFRWAASSENKSSNRFALFLGIAPIGRASKDLAGQSQFAPVIAGVMLRRSYRA
jgi:hypothetical protein